MYLVTLVYGGYLIANGEMQTADLAMYALYIGIFISPIQILVELVEMMQKGLSGFRRFLDVMETESEIRDADNAAELTDVKGHVRYDHVSFHYSDDETPVLSDISIDIPAGKSIALVGPSGSGKTTICSLLPRFYDVTGGSITVDGKDIRGLTLKSLRSQIGMVQQDVYLLMEPSRIILPTESPELPMKRSSKPPNVRVSMTLSWSFRINTTLMSENVAHAFPADRNSGFPLHVYSLRILRS